MNRKINKKNYFTKSVCLIAFFMLVSLISFGDSSAAGDTVVVYYSRTGKSAVVAKAIADHMNADIIKINDTKERSGILGFVIAAYDSQMEHYTQIEPAAVDFSMCKNIYFVSPIWNWKLSVPMRTLLHTANLQGKKMTMVTTANIDIKKYECFGEDAPFIKKFFRDYLRDNRKKMLSLAKSSHADIIQHFHIATEGLSRGQIEAVTIGKISKSVAANTQAAMAGRN